MSNWSSVIVCWCGHDGVANQGMRHEQIRKIIAGRTTRFGLHHSPSCGDGSLGGSCEHVLLAHIEGFDPEWFAAELSVLAWDRPAEVVFFWKDEEMEFYEAYVPKEARREVLA